MISSGTVKVAVVQATPCMFQREASVEKTVALIEQAGAQGANLILFPEVFIGGYPAGMRFGISMGLGTPAGRADFLRYYNSAIQLPGSDAPCPEADRIGQAAAKAGAYVVVGCLEKVAHNATLYCSAAFWGPDGRYLGKHQKIKPTSAERYFWGEGDGSTIPAFDTPYGRIGTLICWENMMPLLRCVLYGKGVGLYLAPTLDGSDTWQTSMRHIASEGRCFVLTSVPYFSKADFPADLQCYHELDELKSLVVRGGSAIIDPFGHYIVEPVFDREDILLAELDLGQIVMSRQSLDVAGHYSRPDLLRLYVNESRQSTFNYLAGGAFPAPEAIFEGGESGK